MTDTAATTQPRLERGDIDGGMMTLYFSEKLDEDSGGGGPAPGTGGRKRGNESAGAQSEGRQPASREAVLARAENKKGRKRTGGVHLRPAGAQKRDEQGDEA